MNQVIACFFLVLLAGCYSRPPNEMMYGYGYEDRRWITESNLTGPAIAPLTEAEKQELISWQLAASIAARMSLRAPPKQGVVTAAGLEWLNRQSAASIQDALRLAFPDEKEMPPLLRRQMGLVISYWSSGKGLSDLPVRNVRLGVIDAVEKNAPDLLDEAKAMDFLYSVYQRLNS